MLAPAWCGMLMSISSTPDSPLIRTKLCMMMRRRSHRSTSFFPKSSMCCGTIAIDLTLLRRFTRMQLPPSA